MSTERVKDKKGENINEGDYVATKYRGGTHQGEVCIVDFLLVTWKKFHLQRRYR